MSAGAAAEARALIGQMVAYLVGAGIDLTDETACISALVGARFRGPHVGIVFDDVLTQAQQTTVAMAIAAE